MTLATRVGRTRLAAVISGTTLLFASGAFAQEGEQADEAPPPAAEPPSEPLYEPAPAAPPPAAEAPEDAQPEAAEPRAALPTEPAEVEDEPGGVSIFAFVDAYYSFNTSSPIPGPGDRAHFPTHRAYDAYNGFNMSFFGTDITYDGGQVGATASLRFGSGYPIFFGDESLSGEPNRFFPLTQAYLTWSPTENLSLDFGQFGTIFGAEVAESWQNLNYTRGALYYAMQPFWHTGLRAKYQASDMVGINAMVINGTNQAFVPENNQPAVAAQVTLAPADGVNFALGYMHQIDPLNSDFYPGGGRAGFDRFVDFVAVIEAGDLTVVGNFDYNIVAADDNVPDDVSRSFWGGSLALGYAITEMFGVAVRGEYLKDVDAGVWERTDSMDPDAPDVALENHLITGTLTLEAKPVENLVIRWDNRFEQSKEPIFYNRASEASDTWFNSILGVVVKSE
jgi:hypothetical protein